MVGGFGLVPPPGETRWVRCHRQCKTKWTESGKGQKKFGGWDPNAIKAHAKLRQQITQRRQNLRQQITQRRRNPKSDKMETKILGKIRDNNEIKGKTYDEYKSIIEKKPTKAKAWTKT